MSDGTVDLTERCFDANLRVDRIVHLPTMTAADLDDDLFDWLTDDCHDLIAGALGVDELEPVLTEYGTEHHAQREAFQELLAWRRIDGWIILASTPQRQRTRSGAVMFSWGCYLSKPFFAATYEDALEQAFTWVADESIPARSEGAS